MAKAPNPFQVELSFDPPGPTFHIDQDARMPEINATASVAGVDLRTQRGVTYSWTVTLTMLNKKVPLAGGRRVAHPQLTRVTTEPTLRLPFTKVRGGQLSVSVMVSGLVVAGARLPAMTATRSDLEVLGSNPTEANLRAAGASDLMTQIIGTNPQHSSSFRGGTHRAIPSSARIVRAGLA